MTDQKYRQKGYSGGSSGKDRSGGGGGVSGGGGGIFDDRPTRMEGAPRGRGADNNRAEVFRCKQCGEKAGTEVTPESLCRNCGVALHACVQCRSFDTSAPFQCKKAIPVAISSKTERNDCAGYEPAITFDLKGPSSIGNPDQARSAFDKLFGKR